MSAAEDLLYYDDIMKGGATQHDMGRHRVTKGDIILQPPRAREVLAIVKRFLVFFLYYFSHAIL